MSKPLDGAGKPLSGKVALVTGAYTGIGVSIAKALAAQGARVVVQHPHIPEAAADVVKEIIAADGWAEGLAADLADRMEYEELVQALLDDCGHWDLLVNTVAGPAAEPFAQISADAFDLGFVATVKGVFHGMQLAARHLADDGRIISVCEGADPGGLLYDAAGGAVERLGRAVAAELAPRRITVNTVGAHVAEPASGELAAAVAGMAEPEAVAYLAGPAASAVTGQVIRLGRAAEPPR